MLAIPLSADFQVTFFSACSPNEIFMDRRSLLWKLNPVLEQLHSHQLPITNAKLLTKETEYGAEL